MKLRLFFLFLLMLLLLGCDNSTTIMAKYSVELKNPDNSMFEVLANFNVNEVVNLPIIEKEDQLFVGWSDGEEIYYYEYQVIKDVTLTAVYEDLNEVFTYEFIPYLNYFSLTGYTGQAKYIRLPESIDGNAIRVIQSKAFENSDFIEVYIPRIYSVISDKAFNNLVDLERVSFYGQYYLNKNLVIDKIDYEAILEENSDTCTIAEDLGDSWKFSDGCPIKEVTRKNSSVIIDDKEYYTLEVIVDLRYFEDDAASLEIGINAFSNLPNLTTVEFPERFTFYNNYIFFNTPKLTNVKFDDNIYLEVIENVVYRKNEDSLVYYPPGLEAESFTVPENITEISRAAFYNNQHLVTLNIGANVERVLSAVFYEMQSLEEFIVDEDNNKLYSVDGVLYTETKALLAYPVAKTDINYEVLGSTLTIAPGAFWGQKYLETISLPEGLTYIGTNAFNDVQKLKVIDLPASVTLIDNYAFHNGSIETVIIRRSGIVNNSITNTRLFLFGEMPTFYVPDDSLDLYIYNQAWAGLMDLIRPMSEYEEE